MDSKSIEISWASLWRILLFAIFVMVLFAGRQVLLGLFVAIVISSGLEVVVNFLESRGVPRTLGVILIFLLALLLVILVIYTIAPRIVVELKAIFSNFSGFGEPAIRGILPFLDFRSTQSISTFIEKISSELFSGGTSPLNFFSRALGGVGLAVAVIVASFYLSLSRDGVERFLKVVLPADYEEQGLRIYERSRRRIGFWFQTQVLLSLIMGLLVWGALELLGVKHAFLLGALAAIFEIVPFVGPIISGAAAVLVAFSVSPTLAFYTLVVFLGLHQLESHVLIPVLTKKAVGLHPVVVIVALLIGYQAWGFLGILVAVPAAAVFEEVIDEWSSAKKKPVTLGG